MRKMKPRAARIERVAVRAESTLTAGEMSSQG